jgi:hypothetical protein
MRKLFFPMVLAALAMPAALAAQSPFDGTWKVDMSKVNFPKDPDTFNLQDGTYQCMTCVPPITIQADGADQPVTGHPYFDSVAIKVVNDNQIAETDKKDGKVVATSTSTVSADGRTMKFEFTDSSNTNGGPPVTGSGEAARVARGPAGAHAISGSWRTTKIETMSDNATNVTYKVDGKEITMTNPTGQSYTAKLNGTDAPMKGDPGITSVSVKMKGKTMLEETDKREGKVIGIFRMTVAPDGKSAKASYEDTLQNRTTEFDLAKQ